MILLNFDGSNDMEPVKPAKSDNMELAKSDDIELVKQGLEKLTI